MFAKISQCTAFEAWSTCILKATNARKNAESTETEENNHLHL